MPHRVIAILRHMRRPLFLVASIGWLFTQPRDLIAAASPDAAPERSWRAALTERLRATSHPDEASEVQSPAVSKDWCFLTANELGAAFCRMPEGVRLESLFDLARQTELLASDPQPLFNLRLSGVGTTNDARLSAETGWRRASVHRDGPHLRLRWEDPIEPTLAGLSVIAEATADTSRAALRWQLRVENTNTDWTLSRVVFPQLALADPGPGASVLFPRGPGEVQTNVWTRPFQYHGNYPGGWCSMQFVAAYGAGETPSGLYVATHDPWGSTKDLVIDSEPPARRLRLAFEHPASELGKPGNGFTLSGEAVWELFRGDWYDAALIYRDWARREARWWPRPSSPREPPTPTWFRELNVWAMGGGASGECVPAVESFQRFMGMPVGFHWYNWHQIPFDNDYPHYFPPKENFGAGVAALKASGVFPMPYINGRLWDSHDRGAEDFEFTRRALASATKQADGKPFLESYGSKETNGEPVRLATMCPATPLWQETVRGTVLRLLWEINTSAVYIDQIAAAPPTLCQDPAHGHPLGGGHWWTEGYWKMLDGIRAAMPRGAALTTECNGEPFIRWFDGYLTWHWQYDGQVPAFPAIYGGTIQMFGRAYRGGATKDLALRMKAGQQLVFGEQLGWLDPGVVNEPGNAAFLRVVARTRQRLNAYFCAGEMARPPRLIGNIPKVRADWQWSGEWWVSTDALLTGAWRLPDQRRLVVIAVNVGDEPVRAAVQFEPGRYGIRSRHARTQAQRTLADGLTGEGLPVLGESGVFPARSVQTWEIRW